jgi:copper resistance protein C
MKTPPDRNQEDRSMRTRRLATASTAMALLLAFPAMASAHAELVATTPEAGASLDDPPAEVVVTFDGELTPASGFTVTDADGHEVGTGELDLDVADRNVLRGEVTITEPGVYTLTWIALAGDEHPEEGSFSFGYLAEVPDGGAEDGHHDDEGGAPNTALPARGGSSPTSFIGLLLLATAGATAVRRAVRIRAGA